MTKSCGTALAALLLLAAGCATTRDQAAMQAPAARSGNSIVPDEKYIARVEQQARVRGVDVKWVNPPRARNGATKPR